MHVTDVGLRLAVALGAIVLAAAAAAQPAGIAFHLQCSERTPAADRVMLAQWHGNAAPGSPDPSCITRQPLLTGLTLKSVRADDPLYGGGVAIVVEFTDDARAKLSQMTLDNVGRKLAVVVSGRIVAMPTIAGGTREPRFVVAAPSVEEAERIAAAIGWSGPVAQRQRGFAAAKDPPGNEAWTPLQGSWLVVAATIDGAALMASPLGASWRVEGTTLTASDPKKGESARFTLADLDTRARPNGFRVTPLASGPDQQHWMIFAREGDSLRLAYHDDPARRASGFEPGNKLVVLTLWPAAKAASFKQAMSTRLCSTVAEDARSVLGDRVERAGAADGAGASCKIEGIAGRVEAFALPLTNGALRAHRVALEREARYALTSVPELGAEAFVASAGRRRIYAAAKGDALMLLAVDSTAATEAQARQLAVRVLSKL